MNEEPTTPDESTEREERIEANRDHTPDRPPTDDEELAADEFRAEHSDTEEDVARHHREMDDIGARVKGEGRID